VFDACRDGGFAGKTPSFRPSNCRGPSFNDWQCIHDSEVSFVLGGWALVVGRERSTTYYQRELWGVILNPGDYWHNWGGWVSWVRRGKEDGRKEDGGKEDALRLPVSFRVSFAAGGIDFVKLLVFRIGTMPPSSRWSLVVDRKRPTINDQPLTILIAAVPRQDCGATPPRTE
jgi:hypothetical protein